MHYELYIDVLFLTNFMMDSLVLLSVNQLLKCSTTTGRIFCTGALGAGLTCGLLFLPMPSILTLILHHTIVNTVLIIVGLKIKNRRLFAKAFALFYISSFLFGGILNAFRPYIKMTGLWFAISVGSYFLMKIIYQFLMRAKRARERMLEVTLCTSSGEHRMTALLDTGNHLSDSLSNEPVSVIDQTLARLLLTSEDLRSGIRYTPYVSVGNQGMMPILRVRGIRIHQEEERWVEKPLIGICEQYISEKNEYQMILHPDL